MKPCNSSVIRQRGESQNGCFRKTKHAKFSKKRAFLNSWYAHVFTLSPYYRRIKDFLWCNLYDSALCALQNSKFIHFGCVQICTWYNFLKIGNNPNGKKMARWLRYMCTNSFRELLLQTIFAINFFSKFILINTLRLLNFIRLFQSWQQTIMILSYYQTT